MATKHTMDVPVTVGDDEVIVAVNYNYSPGRPAVMYLRNGDPGYPADPPEIEAMEMKVKGEHVPQWFADAVCDAIHEWLYENHEDEGPDPDAARDRAIDEKLERGFR